MIFYIHMIFEFAALDISGKNYLSWILNAKIHLNAINIGNTIKEGIPHLSKIALKL